jgi:hypothetical protein
MFRIGCGDYIIQGGKTEAESLSSDDDIGVESVRIAGRSTGPPRGRPELRRVFQMIGEQRYKPVRM